MVTKVIKTLSTQECPYKCKILVLWDLKSLALFYLLTSLTLCHMNFGLNCLHVHFIDWPIVLWDFASQRANIVSCIIFQVIPGLLVVLDDNTNPRVQAHAAAALVNFSDDCPKNILSSYLDSILAKLEAVLSSKMREVRSLPAFLETLLFVMKCLHVNMTQLLKSVQ